MPELNLNYAPTPPWLAENQGKPQFLEARASAQRDRQLGMQERELETRIIAAGQDQRMNELKITETIRQRDQLLEAEFQAQSLGGEISPMLKAHRPMDAMNALLAKGVENPILFKSPQWQTMMKEVQAATSAQATRMQLESMDKLRQTQAEENKANALRLLRDQNVQPEMRQVTGPDGKVVSMIRTGAGTWREVRGDTAESKPEFLKLADALRTTTDPAERTRIEARMASMSRQPGVNDPEFIDLLNRRELAVKSGNTNEVKALDTRLAFLGGERPDTTSPEYLETLAALKRAESAGDREQADRLKARLDKMTAIGRGSGRGGVGGAGSDLTTANVTKAQETLSSAEDALGTVLQVLPLWSMETTGPVGTAGRAFEATVGQVIPRATSEARSRIDSLAPVFQSQMARLFRTDGQMAEPERKAVADAFPKPSASLNPTKASQQGQQGVLVLIQRARRAADQLGQPLPPGLDPVLIANKVRQAVSESGLTVIEGFKTVDELRAEMRSKQRGKSPDEQQRILREYAAKIAASPYRDLAIPNATSAQPNATLDFMQGR